jgi:hypothetical protein
VSAASSLAFVGGFGGVELGLQIAVTEPVDGKFAGERGLEQGDTSCSHRVEGDMPTGFAL